MKALPRRPLRGGVDRNWVVPGKVSVADASGPMPGRSSGRDRSAPSDPDRGTEQDQNKKVIAGVITPLTPSTENPSKRKAPAGWRRGYAADCKSVKTGSIPVPASIPHFSLDFP